MNQLSENSLYTTPAEKENLLKDKEKVASAFFINFLGTLGLFSISSTRGIMKNYFPDDGKLQLVNIGDANKDTSLVTKLYSEIGGLKPDTANKITRLLFKLKTRAITSKNFDENLVREIVKEIQYLVHRPHPVILNVVKQFESGTANLKQVAKAFFNLIKARKREFGPISQEFYSIAKQYQIYLKDVADIGSTPSDAVTLASTIQTFVPHAAAGSFPTTPVSKVVNQKPKADKIQMVAKPAAVKDEDFYLLLWRATSANEIKKLLKERGYEAFTPELMKKAVDYLLPQTNDQEDHFNMVMNSMPDIPTFNKAFGYFMKNDPQQEMRWRLVLLYKASLGKTTAEIKQVLTEARTQIKKLFGSYVKITINGKPKEYFRKKCLDAVIDEFQRKIVSCGPSDDIDAIFDLFSRELSNISSILGEIVQNYQFVVFPDESALSDKEKIKYLIAFSSKTRSYGSINQAINRLINLMKANGIDFIEENRGYAQTIIVQKYENLFPGSKECIDSWYKNANHEYLSFGLVDAYEEIVKNWKSAFLDETIAKFIKNISETESSETIVNKIVAMIDKQAIKPEDKETLFSKIASSLTFGSGYAKTEERAAQVASLIQTIYAKRFKEMSEKGSFKLSESFGFLAKAEFIEGLFELIKTNFQNKPSHMSKSQWDAYVQMMKTILSKETKLQDELIIWALRQGDGIDKVLNYINADWGRLVRVIIRNPEFHVLSSSKEILINFKSAQFLKEEDYQKLAKNVYIGLFLLITFSHKVDPYKYLPYDTIKSFIIENLYNEFSKVAQSLAFKQAFENLKQSDKDEIVNELKDKIFTITSTNVEVDRISLSRLNYFLGKEAVNEYLNSLDNIEKKKALLRQAPDWFFESMNSDNLNDTLENFLQDSWSKSRVFKGDFIEFATKRKDAISLENTKNIVKWMSEYDRELKPSERSEFEQPYYNSIGILFEKSEKEANDVFMQMPLEERRGLVKHLVDKRFLKKALFGVQGDGVLIKPLNPVTEGRLLDILKYNSVETPSIPKFNKEETLTEILSKDIQAKPLEDLHVSLDVLDEEKLDRLSIEYDAFNHYAHGQIALRIKRSFSVSIPLQEEGFKRWLEKMDQEGIDPKIMKPIFHGTGSIGASMILRYGFKVIKSSDPAVVGRMLGDGIYFSNVLDKVAQYVGDEGYSRTPGTQGYIFEMEGSLGKHRRDYRCAGTGAKEDEKSTISPEWAVFNPNEQLRIYKAYHVEVIGKETMDEMKKKYNVTNESAAFEIKSFKSFINEGTGDMPHCITYIFMDGNIPISEKESVDFKSFDAKKFGKNVKLDWTGSGPSVMIYNRKESKTYVVRYTREFMENRKGELSEYLKLLNKK